MIVLGFGTSGEHGKVGFGFGIIRCDHGELATYGKVLAQASYQPTVDNGDCKCMRLVLWRHFDDFSMNQLHTLAIEDPDFGHTVVLIARKAPSAGFGGGRLCNGHIAPLAVL